VFKSPVARPKKDWQLDWTGLQKTKFCSPVFVSFDQKTAKRLVVLDWLQPVATGSCTATVVGLQMPQKHAK
jgi:hypothetical protein